MAGKKPAEGQEPEAQEDAPSKAESKQEAAKAEPKQASSKASEPAAKAKHEPAAEAEQEPAAKASAETAEQAPAEQAPEKKPRRARAKKPVAEAGSETPEAAEQEESQAAEQEPQAAQEKPKPARRERAKPYTPHEGPVRVVRAQARYVRTSARKARLVCDHLRGKSVEEARAILAFNPRGAARDWSKVLESAIANAENNHELIAEDLVVTEAFADEGPTIKRFQPRARGRASSIRKRTSHLTIMLAPERR